MIKLSEKEQRVKRKTKYLIQRNEWELVFVAELTAIRVILKKTIQKQRYFVEKKTNEKLFIIFIYFYL